MIMRVFFAFLRQPWWQRTLVFEKDPVSILLPGYIATPHSSPLALMMEPMEGG